MVNTVLLLLELISWLLPPGRDIRTVVNTVLRWLRDACALYVVLMVIYWAVSCSLYESAAPPVGVPSAANGAVATAQHPVELPPHPDPDTATAQTAPHPTP